MSKDSLQLRLNRAIDRRDNIVRQLNGLDSKRRIEERRIDKIQEQLKLSR